MNRTSRFVSAGPPENPLNDLTGRSGVELLLRRHGLRPDKRLGQNFLIDRSALERVVEAAELQQGDAVLEIGAGLGTLTLALAQRAARVVAIEFDRRLEPVLRETTAGFPGVEVVLGDVLRLDLGSLISAPFHVVANIPYQISSHLIRRLLELPSPPETIVLTVQREVAERIVAGPGEMNLLALGVQAYGVPRLFGRIAAAAFYPSPRVELAIVRIDLYQPPRLDAQRTRLVFRLARAGFSQARKKLRNSLSAGMRISPGQAEGLLQGLGISPSARAQELSLEDWERMAEEWEAAAGDGGVG